MRQKKQTVLSLLKCFNDCQMAREAFIFFQSLPDELGGIKVGQLLEIAEDGTLSAVKQTDQNFTTELKSKLEELKIILLERISLFQKMVLFQQLVVAMAAE